MSSLDLAFKMPENIGRTLAVAEDGKTVIYVAQAWGLHFDGIDDIRGGIFLKKEICQTESFPARRLRLYRSWWPFKLVTETKSREKRKLVWKFQTEFNHDYYFTDGIPATRFPDSLYRGKIKSLATNANIILTDRLLDLVFGPIDEKILELYRTVKRLSRESGTDVPEPTA